MNATDISGNVFWIFQCSHQPDQIKSHKCLLLTFGRQPFVSAREAHYGFRQLPDISQHRHLPVNQIAPLVRKHITGRPPALTLAQRMINELRAQKQHQYRLESICLQPTTISVARDHIVLFQTHPCSNANCEHDFKFDATVFKLPADTTIHCIIFPNRYGIIKFT